MTDGMKNSNASHFPKKFLSYNVNTRAYGFYLYCQEFASLVKKGQNEENYSKKKVISYISTFPQFFAEVL